MVALLTPGVLTKTTRVFTVTRMEGRSVYGDALGRAMERARISNRSLAKSLRPDGSESMRRMLRRYLSGEREPNEATRDEIEQALRDLGADTSELESQRRQSSMLEDLWSRLAPGMRRLLREEVARVDFSAGWRP